MGVYLNDSLNAFRPLFESLTAEIMKRFDSKLSMCLNSSLVLSLHLQENFYFQKVAMLEDYVLYRRIADMLLSEEIFPFFMAFKYTPRFILHE